MRQILTWVGCCLLCLVPVGAWSQSLGGGAAVKENLDLPFDAIGENENEEEAPEIVSFYGTQLEGDGFFYVIDKSGSMQDSGELNIAKREVTRNITEFSDKVRFGIFFFSKDVVKFPQRGQAAAANPAMQASGTNFNQPAQSTTGSCPQAGLSAALLMASNCSSKRKVIVYLGDGGGTCPGSSEGEYLKQTLAAVAAQNWQRIQI